MTQKKHKPGLRNLWQAFDEARFNGRTLNLRESLPTVADASRRAESWLREQQVAATGEVLVVTGRGNNSEGGISPVREAIIRLLHLLRRRGVVLGHAEHTPGSFVVELAPLQALVDAPRRSRDTAPAPRPASPQSLEPLAEETRTLLRNLAERILESLGVQDKGPFMKDEMLRQFGLLAAGLPADTPGAEREEALQGAIRRMLDQYE